MRHTRDNYPTPHSIIDAVLPLLGWQDIKPWEPCAGDGRFADAIDKAFNVDTLRHDITTGHDFFNWHQAQAPDLVTNPPFKTIREFIDHAFAIGVQRMALLCNERLWSCQKGYQQKQRHSPSRFINLTWREDYLQKNGSPDRSLAISIWDRPHSEFTEYIILNRAG
tara:strand:+ start:637 stop:1134 length:498 start_codon:yes stop_codon:yes gene_type:complete